MADLLDLYNRLKQIELEFREARKRLPAHPVKPVRMQTLFGLEDERDTILDQLRALPKNSANPLGMNPY